MAPPWVTFDSIALHNGNCADGADPDNAGLGVRINAFHEALYRMNRCSSSRNVQVILSFVIASVMTTVALILAMILDQVYVSKGQFTLRAPIKYFRERFLDTEWKCDYAWRPFLDPLIIGLGDQQLITGYAVLLSGWIKVDDLSSEI
jgi:hypothetical protein